MCALSATSTFGVLAAFCNVLLAQGTPPLPSFCAPVSPALLHGVEAPYGQRNAPSGSLYCEGLLKEPISFPAVKIISAKQEQSGDLTLSRDKTARVSWCEPRSGDGAMTHLQLRAYESPLYALDSLSQSMFVWNSDLVSRWQPKWHNIGALATQRMKIDGITKPVVLPVRMGPGATTSYTFVVYSAKQIQLSTAILEQTGTQRRPVALKINASVGPAPDTWEVTVPFANLPSGLYRVTLAEAAEESGAATEPIYLLNRRCGER